MTLLYAVTFSTLLSKSEPSSNDVLIRVNPNQVRATVSKEMFGIFFEEINQAGDGGIYAEMVRSRGMEDGDKDRLPSGWSQVGSGGSVSLDPTQRLNASRTHSLRITRADDSSSISVRNEGFWGIHLQKGQRYRLVVWAKGDSDIQAALHGKSGTLGSTSLKASPEWKRHEVILTANGTDPKSHLSLTPTRSGTVWLAFVSLTPLSTFKNRPNGLRMDLAEKVNQLKPGFVRFPGGCYIEGHDLAQAFDWKKSIGPLEERAPISRSFWGYPNTYGLGFLEYLQMCEDMGAEPLFVANCGMSHTQTAPMSEMGRYLQDAMDAIEYANGPVTSKWGALRAKHGRAKPFKLRYVQIGNENGGPAYDERYAFMAKALDTKYPELELVACVWFTPPKSYAPEIIDEHYYNSPSFFWRQMDRYDNYDRKGPKVYVGEFAVTRECGTGNLAAALGEAAFMTGMLRNADVVKMASYAPLLVNVNNRQWNPNAIVFDNHRSYGTPSYWVQRLFAEHKPAKIVQHELRAPKPEPVPLSGRVGLQTWRTQAEFRDIELEVDGKLVHSASTLSETSWERERGQWSFSNGILRQSDEEENRRALLKFTDYKHAKSLRLKLKARRVRGYEGFIIMLCVGGDRELQWNLGGWGNTIHAFQLNGDRVGKGVSGSIEAGRWVDIELVHENNKTSGYLDGKLIETLEDPGLPNFAAVAGVSERGDEIIVTAVNGSSNARNALIDLSGYAVEPTARMVEMKSKGLQDENSFDAPEQIRPRETTLTRVSSMLNVNVSPYSVAVIRFKRAKKVTK